jgi:hypothetical protein
VSRGVVRLFRRNPMQDKVRNKLLTKRYGYETAVRERSELVDVDVPRALQAQRPFRWRCI